MKVSLRFSDHYGYWVYIYIHISCVYSNLQWVSHSYGKFFCKSYSRERPFPVWYERGGGKIGVGKPFWVNGDTCP